MRVDAFDFTLPRAQIAQHPVSPRDTARLLDLTGGAAADRHVRDLPALLRPGDLLVLNDTRVIPARLAGRRGAARVEVTLHQRVADDTWDAFAKPAKRLRPGDRVVFGGALSAQVAAREGGEVRLRFDRTGAALDQAVATHGTVPLPPYIARPDGPEAGDRADYQTVFARTDGAVAAPTAGLHFTTALLDRLDRRGIERVFVTLHVGAGTFLPVTAEDTEAHRMHAEHGTVSADAAARVAAARARGGRVVAVGTTVVRLLESAARADGTLGSFTGPVDLFIVPGYRFKAVDLMLTNFHLPRSTLFMLVCAFAGQARMQAAYRHAIRAGYRFYSYGDATLLARAAAP